MQDRHDGRGGWIRLADAVAARRRGPRASPVPSAMPLPRGLGDAALGDLMLGGRWCLSGVPATGQAGAPPWEARAPGPGFARSAHGFGWLDDLLAAEGGAGAAAAWIGDWIARFGRGRGPGWSAALAGRRAVAWIEAGEAAGLARDAAFLGALARHRSFLERRGAAAPDGMARVEALAGVLRLRLLAPGEGGAAGPLVDDIAQAARPAQAAAVRARDPEFFAALLGCLSGAVAALEAADRPVPGDLRVAAATTAAAVRGLRHADGTLPRMHGAERGRPAAIDADLAALRGPGRAAASPVAGYARIRSGRATLIVDGAAPPDARPGAAHASVLAMELTSGRRPIVVSCGSGAAFGEDWRRMARATASHSVLSLDGLSAARLMPAGQGGGERLTGGPGEVRCDMLPGGEGIAASLQCSHDAWVASHGLTYGREIAVLAAGRGLEGEETLAALTPEDRARLQAVRASTGGRGVPFDVRFHLHPGIDVAPSRDGARLAAPSGEYWEFTHDETCDLRIETSFDLDPRRARPGAARQIVLAGRVRAAVIRVRWRLAKADGTPDWSRDLEAAGGSV